MHIKTVLSSKLTVAALLLLLAFVAQLKFRQYQSQHAIDTEKRQLLQQAADLTKKNQDLSDQLSFLNSDAFKEQVAREQLNLQKQGEVVYSFTNSGASQTAADAQAPAQGQTASNPHKWWNYFFGYYRR